MDLNEKQSWLVEYAKKRKADGCWFDENDIKQEWQEDGHHLDGLLGCDADEADGTEALDTMLEAIEALNAGVTIENHGYDGYIVAQEEE